MAIPTPPCSPEALGRGRRRRREGGFTVIELMTVMVIVAILTSMAVSRTKATIDQGKTAKATGDIRAIQIDIEGYAASGNVLPPGLVDVGRDALVDPWGNPYVYVLFSAGGTPRTDRFGVPLNTQYDIYSIGPDGTTSGSITAGPGQDDVVRGNDGSFIGRATRY
ncbi:MAG: prepilin-type N-terminal cleavage/methylation domain-containing protein [Gemmatimonadota bacterium]